LIYIVGNMVMVNETLNVILNNFFIILMCVSFVQFYLKEATCVS